MEFNTYQINRCQQMTLPSMSESERRLCDDAGYKYAPPPQKS